MTPPDAGYGCANGSPGVFPSQNIFGLVVPRQFVAPNTQQWNFDGPAFFWTKLGSGGRLCGHTLGAPARNTHEHRARLASPANPIALTGAGGTTFNITQSTISNGPARSNNAGITDTTACDFCHDAYSHYHSLQSTLFTPLECRLFQAAYTWSKSTDATSSGNTALNTRSTMNAA